jgi:hypothetical protein
LVVVLLAGSLWGITEAAGGEFLYANGVGQASILLSLVALGILALTRFLVPMRGSSLAIALVAIGYRFLNVGFNACHLGAILCLGGVFEITASWLGAQRLDRRAAQFVLGAVTGVVGFALFAGIMAYGVKDAFWVGVPMKVATHLLSGLVVGTAGLALVPLMHRASHRVNAWVDSAVLARPLASFGVSAAILLVCWIGVF